MESKKVPTIDDIHMLNNRIRNPQLKLILPIQIILAKVIINFRIDKVCRLTETILLTLFLIVIL